MKKSNVYTKTGDKGQTSLIGGSRLGKGHKIIDLYGEVDELNAHLGLAVSQLKSFSSEFEKEIIFLQNLQQNLFNLGSNLACEPDKRTPYGLPQITGEMILELESSIDQMDEKLPELKNFILPGGSLPSAQLHICRTVTRKVERKLMGFSSEEQPHFSLPYLNRLSDYFFVLSRYINFSLGEKETVWES